MFGAPGGAAGIQRFRAPPDLPVSHLNGLRERAALVEFDIHQWVGCPKHEVCSYNAGQLVRSRNDRVKTGAKTTQEPLIAG